MCVIRKREKMYLYVSIVLSIPHPIYILIINFLPMNLNRTGTTLQFLKKWECKITQGKRLMLIYSWRSRLCYRYLCQYSTYKIGHLHCCLSTQGTQNWGLYCSSWYLTLHYFTLHFRRKKDALYKLGFNLSLKTWYILWMKLYCLPSPKCAKNSGSICWSSVKTLSNKRS